VLGINRIHWLHTKRAKKDEMVKTPLPLKSKVIIEKDKKLMLMEGNGKLLPVFSNQKVNSYLKVIIHSFRIHKNITFHSACHIFAT